MARHNVTGEIGETIAVKWLHRKGFIVIVRNYRKKYGEIDIVARETGSALHFIEVKAVSYETKRDLELASKSETWRPEEMVHKHKQDRFKRVIEAWLLENNHTGTWQIDVVTVRIVPREKYAVIKLLENLVFE